jgi:hypothetical protein
VDYENTTCVQYGWHPTPFGNCYAIAYSKLPQLESKEGDAKDIPTFPDGTSWFEVTCAALKDSPNFTCIEEARSVDPIQTIIVPKTVREIVRKF